MKGKPLKEKWAFFVDYYLLPTIIILVVLISFISWRVAVANQKDIVLAGIALNSTNMEDSTDFLQDFYQHAQIDADEETVNIFTNINLNTTQPHLFSINFQLLYAQVGTQDVDFLTGAYDIFEIFAYNRSHMMMDLRNVLPEETLEKLADRLFYVDGDILAQPEDLSGLSSKYDPTADFTPDYPDPRKPEEMIDPIPIGIDILDCEAFHNLYHPVDESLYLGVVTNNPNPEMLMTFLEYLLPEI